MTVVCGRPRATERQVTSGAPSLIIIAVAALLLSACGNQPSTSQDGAIRLDTSSYDEGVGEAAGLDSIVRVDRKAGCVRLESPDGTQRPSVWPEGFTASGSPLTIYDGRGRPAAHEDQPVRGAFTYIEGDSPTSVNPACATKDTPILVTEVDTQATQ